MPASPWARPMATMRKCSWRSGSPCFGKRKPTRPTTSVSSTSTSAWRSYSLPARPSCRRWRWPSRRRWSTPIALPAKCVFRVVTICHVYKLLREKERMAAGNGHMSTGQQQTLSSQLACRSTCILRSAVNRLAISKVVEIN
jgi:hypothetical protein